MDFQTVLLILGILGIILFLVALVMSYKSWRWHTLLLVWLVFAAACVTMWMSLQTLKTHQSWREILHVNDRNQSPNQPIAGLIKKTEKLRQENHELEFGVEDERGRIISPGIGQFELTLATLLLDRGRMWTDAKPVEMSAEDVVTVEFDQPQTHRLEQELPVYVFSSDSFLTGGRYLGMFQVTEVTGNQAVEEEESSAVAGSLRATLRPQWPVAEEEHNRLQNSVENKERWTIYDKMPVDRHLVFAGLAAVDLEIEEEPFDAMNRATRLRKILPQRTVQEFIDDYHPARPEHPPARIEDLVEFLEDYPDDEDEPARFIEGRQVWLPKKGVESDTNIRDPVTGGTIEVRALPKISALLEDEVIERVDEDGSPRYSRQLRDYAHLFRDMHRERKRQDFEIVDTVLKISEVQNLIGEKQQVIKLFEEEKGRLSRDQQQFIHDQKVIDDLVSKVRNKTTSSNRRLVEIRNETIRLGKQLNTKQLDAVEEIDHRAPDPESPSDSG